MMASNSDIFIYKFPEATESCIKIEKLLSKTEGHYEKIEKKIKKYFSFLNELKSKNVGYLESLKTILPNQIVIFLKPFFLKKL